MLTEQLIDSIQKRLPAQIFSIKRVKSLWTSEEAERFENELKTLVAAASDTHTHTHTAPRSFPDDFADAYVFLTNLTIGESFYFREHGTYRYSSFAEVDKYVYSDTEKMTKMMFGLSLAEYLWETLLRVNRFSRNVIKTSYGENYLEIGSGHGKCFLEACRAGHFKNYTAVDVSPASVAMTENAVKDCPDIPDGVKYRCICQDATTLDENEKYDLVVIQEVLEHIEDPLGMMKKIRNILTDNGTAYLMMPIAAPAIHHIFLFKNREHVRSLVEQAGLEIITEEDITQNNIPAEEAEQKVLPIDVCLIVKKK